MQGLPETGRYAMVKKETARNLGEYRTVSQLPKHEVLINLLYIKFFVFARKNEIFL